MYGVLEAHFCKRVCGSKSPRALIIMCGTDKNHYVIGKKLSSTKHNVINKDQNTLSIK